MWSLLSQGSGAQWRQLPDAWRHLSLAHHLPHQTAAGATTLMCRSCLTLMHLWRDLSCKKHTKCWGGGHCIQWGKPYISWDMLPFVTWTRVHNGVVIVSHEKENHILFSSILIYNKTCYVLTMCKGKTLSPLVCFVIRTVDSVLHTLHVWVTHDT